MASKRKKYELTNNAAVHNGITLYQIKALKDFGRFSKGDLGGYIQSENNLSQEGDCWVGEYAKVYENATIVDNAWVRGHAEVYGNAKICNEAWVYGRAKVYDFAIVKEYAEVFGNEVLIYGNAVIEGSTASGLYKGDYMGKCLECPQGFLILENNEIYICKTCNVIAGFETYD